MATFEITVDDEIYREFRKDDCFGPDPNNDAIALENILIVLFSQAVRKDPDTIRTLWMTQRKVAVVKK